MKTSKKNLTTAGDSIISDNHLGHLVVMLLNTLIIMFKNLFHFITKVMILLQKYLIFTCLIIQSVMNLDAQQQNLLN